MEFGSYFRFLTCRFNTFVVLLPLVFRKSVWHISLKFDHSKEKGYSIVTEASLNKDFS